MKLGKQTPDDSGEHVTRSASRERRIGNFVAPEPTPITDDGSITFEHDDHWPTPRIETSSEGGGRGRPSLVIHRVIDDAHGTSQSIPFTWVGREDQRPAEGRGRRRRDGVQRICIEHPRSVLQIRHHRDQPVDALGPTEPRPADDGMRPDRGVLNEFESGLGTTPVDREWDRRRFR